MWYGELNVDFSAYENMADGSLADFAVIGVNPKPMNHNDDRFAYYNFIPQAPVDDKAMISCDVGSYKPNAWGLYDMHGNVSEWVSCDYSFDKEENSLEVGKAKKQVKGGSWRDRPYRAAASESLGYYPWQKVSNVGFRLVMTE